MRLRKFQRLKTQQEFDDIFAKGKRINCGPFILILTPSDQPYFRLGVVASKKIGNAVTRNKAKRLLREAFRTTQDQLPQLPLNIVIIARYSILNYSLVELKERFIKGIAQYS